MHLVIGTPMYGGMCCSEYVQSLLQLQSDMEQNGHKLTCIFLGNESLIQRARNTIAHHFLQTDASHLLFIDADQKFRPQDIVKMIQEDKGIIAGCVPMKGINWQRVKQGAVLNHPDLSKLTGIFNINELEGHKMTDPEQPFQVKHAGTGFMLINRSVFETLKPISEIYTNGGQSIPDGEEVYDFFPVGVYDGKLLSEDFNFCHLFRKAGGTVWAAPWCELGHFGSYLFNGQYSKGVF
jgi:hypothetical protein